jgi:hypothetical protein
MFNHFRVKNLTIKFKSSNTLTSLIFSNRPRAHWFANHATNTSGFFWTFFFCETQVLPNSFLNVQSSLLLNFQQLVFQPFPCGRPTAKASTALSASSTLNSAISIRKKEVQIVSLQFLIVFLLYNLVSSPKNTHFLFIANRLMFSSIVCTKIRNPAGRFEIAPFLLEFLYPTLK